MSAVTSIYWAGAPWGSDSCDAETMASRLAKIINYRTFLHLSSRSFFRNCLCFLVSECGTVGVGGGEGRAATASQHKLFFFGFIDHVFPCRETARLSHSTRYWIVWIGSFLLIIITHLKKPIKTSLTMIRPIRRVQTKTLIGKIPPRTYRPITKKSLMNPPMRS